MKIGVVDKEFIDVASSSVVVLETIGNIEFLVS